MKSALKFDNRTAIVTGGSKGLGRAYAHWLAGQGCAVVVSNRLAADGSSSAQKVVDEIVAAGGRAVAHNGPCETEASAAEMVALAKSNFNSADILICNAGVQFWNNFANVTLEEMRSLMEINLWGTVLPMKAVWPGMLDRGYGRIVLTTSSAGMWGQQASPHYSASKGAIIGLARAVTIDVPEGADIKINVISPAAYTPMSSSAMGEKWADYASPDKVAPVVGWLSSDQCTTSGGIYHAGIGRIRRVQVLEGPIVELSTGPIEQVMGSLTELPEPKSSFGSGAEMMHEMVADIQAAAKRTAV